MTTRTMREMMTITSSTRTAAATVSSERSAEGQRRTRRRFANAQEGARKGVKAAWLTSRMGNTRSHPSTYVKLPRPFPQKRKGTEFNQENATLAPKVLQH